MSVEKLKGRSWPFRWGRGMVTCKGMRVGVAECGAWYNCGGPTQVVLIGGCPGRAFGRMGTLVVRMTGSSVLVEDVVDGGAGGAVGCGSVAVGCVGVVLGFACGVLRVERFR